MEKTNNQNLDPPEAGEEDGPNIGEQVWEDQATKGPDRGFDAALQLEDGAARMLVQKIVDRFGGYRPLARTLGGRLSHTRLADIVKGRAPIRYEVIQRLAEVAPDQSAALHAAAGFLMPSERSQGRSLVPPMPTQEAERKSGTWTPDAWLARSRTNGPSHLQRALVECEVQPWADARQALQLPDHSIAYVAPDNRLGPVVVEGDIVILDPKREVQSGDVVLVERSVGPMLWVFRRRQQGRLLWSTADEGYATPVGFDDVILGVAVGIYRTGPVRAATR